MTRPTSQQISESIVSDELIMRRVNTLSEKMFYYSLSKNIDHTRTRIVLCMSENQFNFDTPYNQFLTNLEENFKTIENCKSSFNKSSYLGIFSALAALYQLLNPPRDINTYQYGPNPFCFGLVSAKAMLDSYQNHKNYQRESERFNQLLDPREYFHISQRGELVQYDNQVIPSTTVVRATILENQSEEVTRASVVAIPLESGFRSIQNRGRGSS